MVGMVGGITAFPIRTEATGLQAPSGTSLTKAAATPGTDFGSVLTDLASSTIENIKTGEVAATLGVRGKLATQDVVQAVLAAEQSLQTAVSIRDKAVAAYQEISRMQI
jgi:flagellar hook-basal body complex protein FliE